MQPQLDRLVAPRAGDDWARHITDVACEELPKGWRYQAVCTCGWVGRVRVDPNDASNAGEDHYHQSYHRRTGKWIE